MPSVSGGSGVSSIPSNEECGIKDVWKHNLEEEFRNIRQVCKFVVETKMSVKNNF